MVLDYQVTAINDSSVDYTKIGNMYVLFNEQEQVYTTWLTRLIEITHETNMRSLDVPSSMYIFEIQSLSSQ